MRVLVTGATGLIGRPLVRRLIERGHEVSILTTSVDFAQLLLPVQCEFYEWTPWRSKIEPEALHDVDAVIHLAGVNVARRRWTPRRRQAIFDSRIGTTRMLLGLIGDMPAEARPSIFISASAVGFYGHRFGEMLDEGSDAGRGFLADVCKAWEGELARVEALGMRAVGMRTGVVLSRDGGALGRILPTFRLGLGGPVGGGRQWMSWIHLDDLVSLYVYALENDAFVGPVNAVAPAPVTNAQFTRSLRRALGRPAFLPIPAPVLRAFLGARARLLLDSQRVHPAEALGSGFQFDYPELDQAMAELCGSLHNEYRSEFWLTQPPEDVVPFFADTDNIERLAPRWMGLSVKSVSTPALEEGTVMEFRLRPREIPFRWRLRVEEWDPPRRCTTVQARGPFKTWKHIREFEPFDDGTVVRDIIRYEVPGGAVGQALVGRTVARDIHAAFSYRRRCIFDFFG